MTLRTNRAFRRLFLGRVTTNAGDSIYLIVTMWLVYDLTGSTLYTGAATFLLTAPNAVGFLFGPLADRWPSRPVLVGTQAIQAVAMAGVTVAWALGYQEVWLLLVVIPLLALVNQLVYPTMNAVLPRVVEQEDLMAANSSFALAFQGLDTLFNALGGLLLVALGAVALYALDVVTFLVALGCYALVEIPPPKELKARDDPPAVVMADGEGPDEGPENEKLDGEGAALGTAEAATPPAAESSYRDDLREGVGVFRGSLLWKLSLAVFLGILSYWAMFAALPAFADATGGVERFGIILGALAGGMLVGFVVAPRLQSVPFGLVMAGLGLFGAAGWLVVLTVRWLPAVVVAAGCATVVIGVHSVGGQTLFQTAVPEALLGRVTSLHISVAGVAAPLGALLGGAVGDAFGATVAVSLLVVGHAAVSLIFLLDGRLRGLPAVDAVAPADLGLAD